MHNRKYTKIISILLAASMISTSMPVMGYAAEVSEEQTREAVQENDVENNIESAGTEESEGMEDETQGNESGDSENSEDIEDIDLDDASNTADASMAEDETLELEDNASDTADDSTSAAEDETLELDDGSAPAEVTTAYKDIAWLQTKITTGIDLSSDKSKIASINIQDSKDLIFLSQLSPELYEDADITLSQSSATAYFDITSNHPIKEDGSDWNQESDANTEKYTYQLMGSQDHPFKGTINYGSYKIVGTTPLFDYLGAATITGTKGVPLTLARYTYLSTEEVSPMLANHYVSTEEKEYSIKLEQYSGLEYEPKFDGIIGEIADGASIILNVESEKKSAIEGSENAGFICNILGQNSSLKINSLPTIANDVTSAGSAGGLVGYAKANAEIEVNSNYEYQGTVSGQNNAGGIIGTLENNAVVKVNGNTTVSGKINAVEGNAGGLVGDAGGSTTENADDLNDGVSTNTASIIVSGKVSARDSLSVMANSAAAGGIAGKMAAGSSLSIGSAENRTILNNVFNISGSMAGALIGNGEDVKISGVYATIGGDSLEQAPTITGRNEAKSNSNSIGGLIGTYKTTGADETFNAYNGADDSILQVKYVKLKSEDSDDKLYAGGLIGILDLCSNFEVSSAQITSSMAGVANYGGLVGNIKSTSIVSDEQKLNVFKVSANSTINTDNASNADLVSYGGIAACADNVYVNVADTASVIAINNAVMTTDGHYFGGAVAKLGDGSVLDISDNANYNLKAEGIIYGGGIAGYTGKGSAVRLAGITDLSNVSFTDKYSTYYTQSYGVDVSEKSFGGQIVGTQNSSLIYAAKTWILKRPAKEQPIDDIGNYGSVIRLGKNKGCGSGQLGDGTGLDEELISIDTDTNRIKLKSGLSANIANGAINIENVNQFALLAIEEQTTSYFSVYGREKNKGSFILENEVNVINLTKDIDLRSTGIYGSQRDCYLGAWAFPETIKEANINGNNNSITLAAGETFGYRNDTVISTNTVAGSGQIHGHAQVGLFSQANGSFKDITFAGTINLWEREGTTKEVGAAVAVNTWETSYENVTTNVEINSLGKSESYSHVGGLIGRKNNNKLTINNCVGNAVIKAENSNNVSYGGILGYFTGTGTISVDTLQLIGNIKDQNISDARVGGFIAIVDKSADLTMTLNNLIVDGQMIETNASSTSGGLLGYDWNNTKATFGNSETVGVKVEGNSTVNVTGDASCGALVYLATGYWQVNSIDLKKMSVTSGSGDCGLLVCSSIFKDAEVSLFLYLEETSHNAYQIGPDVKVENAGGNFDEWVVYTAEKAEEITGNECSVVSIATSEGTRVAGSRVGVDPEDAKCTSYQNRTEYGKTAQANPNARYYYDLDVIRAKFENASKDEKIDSAEELMLWSVYHYTLRNDLDEEKKEHLPTNISSYFAYADAASAAINGDKKEIDLTGFSFYPLRLNISVSVADINLKFANKEIERAEKQTNDLQDSLNRKTGGTSTDHTQHYLMHYGLFMNVSGGLSVNISGVSFGGTVGYSEGISGALICGNAWGESSTKILNIKLSGITLDGIKLYDGNDAFDDTGFAVSDQYAALLISTIGSYTTLEVTKNATVGIETTKKYSNTEKNTTYYAAGSLFGTVGSTNGTYIHMNFLGIMALDGRSADNTVKTYDDRYGTYHSIFTRATLLESFQYPDNETSSGGFYNFNKNDTCTYGKEISNTSSGRNPENQYQYYDDKTETGYVTDKNTGADAKKDHDGETTGGFSAGYLRYVYNVENGTTNWELDINQKQVAFDVGCGTYGHPYEVTSADQLMAIMDILDTATFKPGFVIRVNTKVLAGGKGDLDYHNTTSGNDLLLYYDGAKWLDAQKSGDSYQAGQTEQSIDKSKLLTYIRNAYYMITTDIDLDVSSFRGLGSHELTDGVNTGGAFSGVIIGKVQENGEFPTITLSGKTSRDNFGGLVRYSQGSVIKDLNIKYKKKESDSLTINNKANTGELETQPFFGGVIGWAFGGDSIIDNVNVTYDAGYISVANTVTPAGGFVGIVGGDVSYGGGVVFRNMDSSACSFYIGSDLSSSDEHKTKYYWNPFVGRVYDGYACYDSVNSSDAKRNENSVYLDNMDKDYTIPNLKSTEKLSVDKWSEKDVTATVSIGNAEQLWVLAAIVCSGAGGAQNEGYYTDKCKAYSYGKVRSGKYDSIGGAQPNWLSYDEERWGGVFKTEKMKKIPYLIRNYTSSINGNSGLEHPMVRVTGADTLFELSFSTNAACDMSVYGNGFRGIGPSYLPGPQPYTNNKQGITGEMERKIIRMSKVSGVNNNSVKIEIKRNLNLPDKDGTWICSTLGLFTYLHVCSDLEIENIEVGGEIRVNNEVEKNADILIGGIASGIVYSKNAEVNNSTLTFKNVYIKELEIKAAYSSDRLWGRYAAGFLGSIYYVKQCVFENCGYDTLTIRNSRWTAGGFAGTVLAPIVVKGTTEIKNGVFDQNVKSWEQYVSDGYVSGDWYAVGGLFGYNEFDVSIENVTAKNINLAGWVTGGLIGACKLGIDIKNVTMENSTSVGLNTIASVSGGIVGLYTSNSTDGKYIQLENISVSEADILMPKASKEPGGTKPCAGGIIGSSRRLESSKERKLVLKKCYVSDSALVSEGPVGGIIGDSGQLATGTGISDTVVSKCKIASINSTEGGVGGLIGLTSSTVKGYNLYSQDNIVGYLLNNAQIWSGNYDDLKKEETVDSAAFQVLDPAKITKANVGLKSTETSYCTYENYLKEGNTSAVAENSNAGIWIGNTGADDREVQLIAVKRSGDCTAVHNFGRAANSANTRVIYNDYTGVGADKMDVSNDELTSTDTTWPYIAENPEYTFSTEEGEYKQYGDGMGFASETNNKNVPIAKKIAQDAETVAENPTGYSTGYKYFYDACKDDFTENKWKYQDNFASFLESEEIQNANITDFPVLVVEDSSNINEQIKETLKLLTNSSYVDTAVRDSDKVECNVLSLNDNDEFSVGESKVRTADLAASNAAIWYDTQNKVFRAKSAVAFDSGKKQFTLVTVTLGSDPNNSNKEFKVSLAVYVQKNIYFKFYASGISGTTYETNSYMRNNSAVMTNYGDSFTEMLSFEFERTNDEWLQALNAGENLCVSYDKAIWLGDMNLPTGTRFVLVDPQQSGKTAYYSTLTETNKNLKLSFSDFEGWKDVSISDYLKAKTTEVDDDAEGTKFVEVQTVDEATVKCGDKYYRLATSEELEDTTKQKYTISFENKNDVKYNYYLTIVTPENESQTMLNNLITYEDTWLNCETAGGIRAKNNNSSSGAQKTFARDGNANRYIIYNFFSQTMSVTNSNPGNLLVDDVSKTVTLTHTITDKIKLDENTAAEFRRYATDNTKLFQQFDMSLKDVDGSTETSAVIAAGTQYEITYVVETTDSNGAVQEIQIPGYKGTISADCTTYSFPYASKDMLDNIIGFFTKENYNSITMKATLNLIYDEETLYKQFKVKTGSSEKNDFGIRYSFTSKLSMNENTIAATSVKAQDSVQTLFYRASYELSKLSYNAVDGVETEERSGDISKLGINAFSSKEYNELLNNPSEISSIAGYDVTAMKNREGGSKIHCVFELYYKNENGAYTKVSDDNISNYLTAPKIRNVNATVDSSSNTYVLDFNMTDDEKQTYATVPITFAVDYEVYTGDKLPNAASYSNYKVVLKVDMQKSDGTSLDMQAEDYIIYTNAKVNPAIQPNNKAS